MNKKFVLVTLAAVVGYLVWKFGFRTRTDLELHQAEQLDNQRANKVAADATIDGLPVISSVGLQPLAQAILDPFTKVLKEALGVEHNITSPDLGMGTIISGDSITYPAKGIFDPNNTDNETFVANSGFGVSGW